MVMVDDWVVVLPSLYTSFIKLPFPRIITLDLSENMLSALGRELGPE
jgi:hypothetical protein